MRLPLAIAAIALLLATGAAQATEFFVATGGNDGNPGTAAAPLRTIQHGAELAQPGDTITVRQGVYRERIDPPRGGDSDAERIVYQAAPGEKVEITGSEPVKDWQPVQGDVWKVTIPNSFFGKFNPYSDLIHGAWFDPRGRQHHTGAVYLNGEWLVEAAKLEEVFGHGGKGDRRILPERPSGGSAQKASVPYSPPLWFGQVDGQNTTIWAQFKGVNPNQEQVEINVRQTVFYPAKTGMNFITVRGFSLRDAATPWAPPAAEQIGLIGTHWSKGWIIENNRISHSACCGVALGKYGDQWDNKSETAEGYVQTIQRALQDGWSKQNIGHHVVRNNLISHCGQAGVVGSLGAAFSLVTGNTIHDIHVRTEFGGAEMAGIKFHGAIDVEISRNHIYRNCRGIWLDWMAQGARVSGNLFHDNPWIDLFVEVDHGPFLVDNNIFLSPNTLFDVSHGGAYVHNLIAGSLDLSPFDSRRTPFHKPHSTELAGRHDVPSGDDRFYNNLFVGRADWSAYDAARLPLWMDGNVFLHGAKPSKHEKAPLVLPDFDPAIRLAEKADGVYLEITLDRVLAVPQARRLVTTGLLGKAAIPNLPYERPDGSPLTIATDYFGRPRNQANPAPGPFEHLGPGRLDLKVW